MWDVLHLGAFQLAFLTHVPKHAAVNETVELATHVGSPKAKGFVNGVLRRVAELVTDEFTDKPRRGRGAVRLATAHPLHRQGLRPLPQAHSPDPPRPAATRPPTSRPRSRCRSGSRTAGSTGYGPEECTRLGFWFNARRRSGFASTSCTPTARRTASASPPALIDAEPGEHPQSLRLPEHHADPRPARLRRRRLRGAGSFVDARRVGARRAAGNARARPLRRPRRQDDAPRRADGQPRPHHRLRHRRRSASKR